MTLFGSFVFLDTTGTIHRCVMQAELRGDGADFPMLRIIDRVFESLPLVP